MTEHEYKQIEEIFKPIKLLDELQKIDKNISEIDYILYSIPFNEMVARQKISSINNDHPENVLFYNLFNPPNGNTISVSIASANSLKEDLTWKKIYLSIKADAKILSEVIHKLETHFNRTL